MKVNANTTALTNAIGLIVTTLKATGSKPEFLTLTANKMGFYISSFDKNVDCRLNLSRVGKSEAAEVLKYGSITVSLDALAKLLKVRKSPKVRGQTPKDLTLTAYIGNDGQKSLVYDQDGSVVTTPAIQPKNDKPVAHSLTKMVTIPMNAVISGMKETTIAPLYGESGVYYHINIQKISTNTMVSVSTFDHYHSAVYYSLHKDDGNSTGLYVSLPLSYLSIFTKLMALYPQEAVNVGTSNGFTLYQKEQFRINLPHPTVPLSSYKRVNSLLRKTKWQTAKVRVTIPSQSFIDGIKYISTMFKEGSDLYLKFNKTVVLGCTSQSGEVTSELKCSKGPISSLVGISDLSVSIDPAMLHHALKGVSKNSDVVLTIYQNVFTIKRPTVVGNCYHIGALK